MCLQAAYVVIVGFIYCFSPRKLHTLVLATVILLYYSFLQIFTTFFGSALPHSTDANVLPMDRIPDLFSSLLVFCILMVAITDLLIYGVDVVVVSRLVRIEDPAAWDLQRLSSTLRPRLIHLICNHPVFFAWQVCMRYLCPLIIGVLHFCTMCCTCVFASIHSRHFFGLNHKSLRESDRERRRRRAGMALTSVSVHAADERNLQPSS